MLLLVITKSYKQTAINGFFFSLTHCKPRKLCFRSIDSELFFKFGRFLGGANDGEWTRLLYWARPFKEVQETFLRRFLLKMLSLHQLLEVPIVKKLETRFGKVHVHTACTELRLF